MRRFLVDSLPAAGGEVALPDAEAHHALRVLRLQQGTEVCLLDGCGGQAEGVLQVAGKKASVQIGPSSRQVAPQPQITLYCALPKGDRATAMLERLAQLGCGRLVPLVSAFGMGEPRENKLEKLQRAADEALKQSGRTWRLTVAAPMVFDQVLLQAEGSRVLADPCGESVRPDQSSDVISVLVGPEGGLSDAERSAALAAGFMPWRLSDAILRIETAAELATGLLRVRD